MANEIKFVGVETLSEFMDILHEELDNVRVTFGDGLSVNSEKVVSVNTDDALDTTSTNPVQNKVIAQVIGDINSVLEEVL